MLTVFAPAKINLHLHVTGRQSDGYHLLDSLAVFADSGDTLIFNDAGSFSFDVEGPFAAAFTDAEKDASPQSGNLVVKAARRLSAMLGRELNVSIRLIKNVPLGSGLGGGSADAAACIRGLCQFWNVSPPQSQIDSLAFSLGRDVPVCLKSRSCIMRGTGEQCQPAPNMPALPAVLAWPARSVSTANIFKSLKMPAYSQPAEFPDRFEQVAALCDVLNHSTRNDLQQVSLALVPAIAQTLHVLEHQPGCLLSRMSGSGSACFGLFETEDQTRRAADAMALTYPDWWIQAGWLNFELRN